ncbi:MAG: hypothetical protein RSC85_01330 [Bacilli bacterium]
MDILVTKELLDLLMISITFSIILMAIIQKIKKLTFINKYYQVWLLNLILSFIIGLPFSMYFYNLKIYQGIWISIFAFIGAPTLYEALKKQNLINYKPSSMNPNTVSISSENEIKRDKI